MSLSIEGIDFSEIKELDLHPGLYKAVLKKNSAVCTVKDGFYLHFYFGHVSAGQIFGGPYRAHGSRRPRQGDWAASAHS